MASGPERQTGAGLHIGCSGYYYRHWQGTFYPPELPASRWFDFYAGHFDTLEINSSFYRFPSANAVRHWAKQAPAGFVYSVKAPRLITHLKRFHACDSLLDDFYAVLAGLGEHLGCVLFQLPPSLHYSEENLAQLLAAMHPDFCNVIEFRHASWWCQAVYDALIERGITFCSVSAAGLPDDLIATADHLYLRLHGEPWYAENYSEEKLCNWARRITAARAANGWVYFNNDHHAYAPSNAARLRTLLCRDWSP